MLQISSIWTPHLARVAGVTPQTHLRFLYRSASRSPSEKYLKRLYLLVEHFCKISEPKINCPLSREHSNVFLGEVAEQIGVY